jgi:hypothetical protein
MNKKVPVWRLWSEEVRVFTRGCEAFVLQRITRHVQDIVRGDAGILADLLNDIRAA